MCAIVALAAGCASSPSHFYTLSATVAPVAATSKISVVVGPVTVPAAVDQPQIVVSTGANQVTFDEFNRWASPLQDNIARVVAENLVAALGTPRVTLFPQTLNVGRRHSRRDRGSQFRIDAGQDGVARRDLDACAAPRTERPRRGAPACASPCRTASYEALAAAHSRAVARLSQDIAEAVKPMERPAP